MEASQTASVAGDIDGDSYLDTVTVQIDAGEDTGEAITALLRRAQH